MSLKYYMSLVFLATCAGITCGNEEAVGDSIEKYANRFLRAAGTGQIDIVQQMISQFPQLIHVQDRNGQTALHRAIKKGGFLPVVKLLVVNNIDINRPNKHGATPLFMAALAGRDTIVDFLIRNAADCDQTNRSNKPPLYWAACFKRRHVVRHLVKANVKIDAETENMMRENLPEYDFRKERREYYAARTHAFATAVVRMIYLPDVLRKLIFEFESGSRNTRPLTPASSTSST